MEVEVVDQVVVVRFEAPAVVVGVVSDLDSEPDVTGTHRHTDHPLENDHNEPHQLVPVDQYSRKKSYLNKKESCDLFFFSDFQMATF